jgi:UDP-N-acetylmuramate--alanine ligase
VTNIDNDHLDYYGSFANIKNAFTEHANSVPFYGCAILCSDDKNVCKMLPQVKRKYYTYGLKGSPDFKAEKIAKLKKGFRFGVKYRGRKLGVITLQTPGVYNILNSLASVAVGIELGIPFSKIASALKSFKGVGRRIEIKGTKKNILVIDDYGHHPTEVKETIKAVKENWPKRRLVVLFQPHRYSRTASLYNEFGPCFKMADEVKLLSIYPAGEKPLPGVTSQLIYKSVRKYQDNIEHFKGIDLLVRELKPNDTVLTLGAGNVWKTGEDILKKI